jgi:surface polysaccharide O-acyltransferase-like enzyme
VNYDALTAFLYWYFGSTPQYGPSGWTLCSSPPCSSSIGYATCGCCYLPTHRLSRQVSYPTNKRVALLALMIAASFIVRLWFPSDTVFVPLVFQLADFPQYIALFIVGIVAYRRDWLNQLPGKTGRLWMTISIIFILLWPPFVLLLGALEDASPFQGGLHWQSALAAVWQAFLGIAMCVTVIHIFKTRFDRHLPLERTFSQNAYTAYLIHEPVITISALIAAGLMLYPLLKFGLMALVAVPLVIGISALIRRLPLTGKVLQDAFHRADWHRLVRSKTDQR